MLNQHILGDSELGGVLHVILGDDDDELFCEVWDAASGSVRRIDCQDLKLTYSERKAIVVCESNVRWSAWL